MADAITHGHLNSERGKAYAQSFRKAALLELANWAQTASDALTTRDPPKQDEQADAAFYFDLECLLRQAAKHAS